MSDTFPTEEYGSGSRATLTPSDRAFLESPPTYEDGGSPSIVEPIPARPEPSAARRVSSLLLFTVIAGGASLVLVLAVARTALRALFP
jgi:hypothetical protein